MDKEEKSSRGASPVFNLGPKYRTNRTWRKIAGYEKPRRDSEPSFCNYSFFTNQSVTPQGGRFSRAPPFMKQETQTRGYDHVNGYLASKPEKIPKFRKKRRNSARTEYVIYRAINARHDSNAAETEATDWCNCTSHTGNFGRTSGPRRRGCPHRGCRTRIIRRLCNPIPSIVRHRRRIDDTVRAWRSRSDLRNPRIDFGSRLPRWERLGVDSWNRCWNTQHRTVCRPNRYRFL